jgi:LacI family transcriptional regulator
MAQSLKQKQSRSIGVLLCSIPNYFFAEVISGIESIASNKDYHVMISQSHESFEKEKKELQNFEWKSVDGLLVSLSSETNDVSHFEAMIERGVPLVFFDRTPEKINAHKIIVDDLDGSYQLTKHLLDEGCKRIAHITSSPQLSITQRRLEGYQKALLEREITINKDFIKYCMHGGKEDTEVAQATEQLLNLKKPPDAITTASDRITLKTFTLLKNKGIEIPKQIALGGFSNFSAPELFSPSLTTIVQPAFDVGRIATEMLLELIESKKAVKEFSTIVLPTELKIRGSSRKATGYQ